jgi:hypothetical protein
MVTMEVEERFLFPEGYAKKPKNGSSETGCVPCEVQVGQVRNDLLVANVPVLK